ncbi:MAG: glutamate--tRNA ligase [Elusimicrobiota bacterium]
MNNVRVRFAPSPTGFLHIGGARTALFNWLFAQKHKGVFILRIEDTDEARSTPESVSAILDSMDWLGLEWQEGPDPKGPSAARGSHGPYFQMQRWDRYKEAAARLVSEGKAYPCYCTKEELDAMRRKAAEEKKPLRYNGRCRDLSPDERSRFEAEGRKPSLRLRMPHEGNTEFDDIIRGHVAFDNTLLQDIVIQKTTGGPTYNFACVVDDHAMEISHVIRADEHLPNTPYQTRIYQALGYGLPAFAHLSMILGPDGHKLSKRHGATAVGEYRDQGYLPEALRNYLALLGWSTTDSQQLFGPQELVDKFDLAGCQKNPAVFDPVKLTWMNGEYLRAMPKERLLDAALPFLAKAGMGGATRERMLTVVALEQEKFKLLADVPARVDIFFKDVAYQDAAVNKVLKQEGAGAVLAEMEAVYAGVEPFSAQPIEAATRRFCEGKGLKPGKVFHPVRVAVSGRTEGPTLFCMLEILGKEEVLRRLRKARQLIY